MNTKDINIHESGDGGQITILNNDLLLGEVAYNQFYLALFGGNIEANTLGNEIKSQLTSDYWQNSLFYSDRPNKQLNSNTERVLSNLVLNDSGKIELTNAINSDLSYLSSVFVFSVEVFFEPQNKVVVNINFSEKTGIQEKILQMVFNNAKKEIIIQRLI